MNSSHYFVANRLALASLLVQKGWKVSLAAHPDNKKSIQEITSKGVTFYPLPIQRQGLAPLSALISAKNLWTLLRKVQPDVVFSYTLKTIFFSGILCRILNIPYICLITGIGNAFTSYPQVTPLLYRLALSHPTTKVCFQNSENKEFFLHNKICKESQAHHVGGGIDLSIFAEHPMPKTKTLTILFAARLLQDKGVKQYIQAAKLAKEQNLPITFQLAGSADPGNPQSLQEEEVIAVCKQCDIEWLGFCDPIQHTIASVHVVCLPTQYGEGVPSILLQAAAMGRAVISSDTPGCRDIVIDRENGFLIPAGNHFMLLNAFQHYVHTPELIQIHGKKSRQIAEQRFCHKQHKKRIQKVLDIN